MLIVNKKSPKDIYNLWMRQHSSLKHYRDNSSLSTPLTILDALKALEKAIDRGWFDFYNFDHLDWEKLARYDYGDLSWVVPKKIMAFSSPDDRPSSQWGNSSKKVMRHLQENGVKNILRLNEPFYDKRIFTSAGIKHFDVHYPDGTNPTDEVVQKVKKIWAELDGPIAIHCRAGLGRTGTQIGIMMMTSYGFTSKESIAWMRICRSGMVIAQQADYLCMKEKLHLNLTPQRLNFDDSGLQSSQVSKNNTNKQSYGNSSTRGSTNFNTSKFDENVEITPTKVKKTNFLTPENDLKNTEGFYGEKEAQDDLQNDLKMRSASGQDHYFQNRSLVLNEVNRNTKDSALVHRASLDANEIREISKRGPLHSSKTAKYHEV
jgi:protein-tyrosine phosphatase